MVATADQRLHLLDNNTGCSLHSFPATTVPPRRFNFGECAILTAGRDWIASVDPLRGVAFFYDAEGAPLGRVRLPGALPWTHGAVHTVRGAGDYLGVGHATSVTTLRVVRKPACSAVRRGGAG